MRSIVILVIAGMNATAVAAAQEERKIPSCAEADALLGPAHKPKLFVTRDKLTDSVFLSSEPKAWGTDLFSNNYIHAMVVLRGIGSADSRQLAPELHVRSRKGFAKGETISEERVWLGDSIRVTFLVDDSLRFQIGPMIETRELVGKGVFRSAEINEDYWAPITGEQLLMLARGKKGLIGIGDKRSSLGQELKIGSDAMLRVMNCEAWKP